MTNDDMVEIQVRVKVSANLTDPSLPTTQATKMERHPLNFWYSFGDMPFGDLLDDALDVYTAQMTARQ